MAAGERARPSGGGTKFGMSRRNFVRTAAATAIGFWAIDAVRMGSWGNYGWAHNTQTTDACDLEWDGRRGIDTLNNLPGEFIFDVQSHHVDPDGDVAGHATPAIHAFFAALWPQSSSALGDQPGVREDGSIRGGGAGEVDPIENLSRYHYLKELYLDSATTATVLSCVPTSPDTNNPLPIAEAAQTVDTGQPPRAARSAAVMHAFVMPNRGSAGQHDSRTQKPMFLRRGARADDAARADVPATCCAAGRPTARGATCRTPAAGTLDTDTGMAFLEQVLEVHRRHPDIPPVVATHKGFALPGFDQRAAHAARHRPRRARLPRRATSSSTTRATTPATRSGPTPATTRRPRRDTRSTR